MKYNIKKKAKYLLLFSHMDEITPQHLSAEGWKWISAVNYRRLTYVAINYRWGHLGKLLVFFSFIWCVNNNNFHIFLFYDYFSHSIPDILVHLMFFENVIEVFLLFFGFYNLKLVFPYFWWKNKLLTKFRLWNPNKLVVVFFV